MPKKAKELSALEVKRLRHGTIKGSQAASRPAETPCIAYHAVGGVSGLMLQCRPPAGDAEIGARSWILRTMVAGKRRDIGLGGYPEVTLAQARENAREIK